MGRYDFSDLIDLSWTKDLTTIPDLFAHDSCLTYEESERKLFFKPVTEGLLVIGDVEIGPGANVWFYSVIRGDLNYIRIGSNCNIQDSCVLHVDKDFYPLVIEDGVVLGHRVVVHGCRIGKGSLIGIGAIVLNGAEIGEESIVGAGSVVTPQTKIPPRTLALGIPAKPIRPLDEKDFDMIRNTISDYQALKKIYHS